MRRILWIIGLLVIASLLAKRMGFHVIGMVTGNCDPFYPTLCIPIGTPDLDCTDVSASNFPVVGRDSRRFDGDDDGLGCEPWPRRQSSSRGGWMQGNGQGFGR